MKRKRFLYLILPVITLVFEILPYGAVCNFANPEGKPWRETYSYFSLLPFGYANFAPLLTGLITCVIVVMLIVYCFTGKYNIVKIAKAVLCVAVVLSLCPLLLGTNYFSVVGILITLSLISELILLHFAIKRTSNF